MLGVKQGADEVTLKIGQMLIRTKAKLYQNAFPGNNV